MVQSVAVYYYLQSIIKHIYNIDSKSILVDTSVAAQVTLVSFTTVADTGDILLNTHSYVKPSETF